MHKIFGYAGKVLRIDLTSSKISIESIFNYPLEKFIGGRGLNQWILFNEVKTWVSPFDPNNRLILGSGPLVGTLTPCTTRLSIDSKSPITGGVGSGNICGNFSTEMKFAGYDNIIIQGKSRIPIYIWIENDNIQITDANYLWGKNTWETEDQIKNEHGQSDLKIISIGPAGENLVKYACIISDRDRAVGRCGLGAIMGSKNLKAIAIKGSKKVKVADKNKLIEINNFIINKIKQSERAKILKDFGTYGRAEFLNELSLFPYKNFLDDAWDKNKLKKVLLELNNKKIGNKTYPPCNLYCIQLHKYIGNNLKEEVCGGIKFNSIWNFGSRLDISDAEEIIKLNNLCNMLGLDIDSTSSSISWAIEIYEKKIISNRDTNGMELKWSNEAIVKDLIKKIANREGFGNILAEGCSKAASIIKKGSEYYAINIKGQDSIEPIRAAKGWALGCCVSTRGGTHTRGANLIEISNNIKEKNNLCKLLGIKKIEGPFSYRNKAELVIFYERLQAIVDSLGICLFSSMWWSADLLGPKEYARIFKATTGIDMNEKRILKIGERIHNIEKAFNTIHAGFWRKDDYPPLRFMKEKIKSGKYKGEIIKKENWDKLLEEYYLLQGWDKNTGLQKSGKLKNLNLKEIAKEIEKLEKIKLKL
jgi:aldehyde:ferredoxin oxidoreductase